LRRSPRPRLSLVVVCLLSASPAWAVGVREQESCTSSEANPYVGTYRWRGAPQGETVRFWFDRTEETGNGIVKAVGRGVYVSSPPVNITIRAEIDLKTRRIEIWESKPDQAAFETNGSHVGTISADRCRIDATWTTKGTGQQGVLILEIQPK